MRSDLSEVLRAWVHGACMSVSGRGRMSLFTNSESRYCETDQSTHRRTHVCNRYCEKWTLSVYSSCSRIGSCLLPPRGLGFMLLLLAPAPPSTATTFGFVNPASFLEYSRLRAVLVPWRSSEEEESLGIAVAVSFAGWMLSLSPNQRCQSSEGTMTKWLAIGSDMGCIVDGVTGYREWYGLYRGCVMIRLRCWKHFAVPLVEV